MSHRASAVPESEAMHAAGSFAEDIKEVSLHLPLRNQLLIEAVKCSIEELLKMYTLYYLYGCTFNKTDFFLFLFNDFNVCFRKR